MAEPVSDHGGSPCLHFRWVWSQIDDDPVEAFCQSCGVTITHDGVTIDDDLGNTITAGQDEGA